MAVHQVENSFILENEVFKVIVEPFQGGKIRSLVSKNTGQEYFYADRRNHFDQSSFSAHDISGFDECFPTLSRGIYPEGARKGRDLGDHGLLWQQQWAAVPIGNGLEMSVTLPGFDCTFHRTCHLGTNSLYLDYRIENHAGESFKLIYSAHPMLYADETTRIFFPPEMDKAFIYSAVNVPDMKNLTWTSWPPPDCSQLSHPFTAQRHNALKVYSPALTSGKVLIHYQKLNEVLAVEFDCRVLRHLGYMVVQGYNPLGQEDRDVFLGVEPATSIGDDFDCARKTETLLEIPPQGSMKFWIKFSLVSNHAER